jgi:hypothetical protein
MRLAKCGERRSEITFWANRVHGMSEWLRFMRTDYSSLKVKML